MDRNHLLQAYALMDKMPLFLDFSFLFKGRMKSCIWLRGMYSPGSEEFALLPAMYKGYAKMQQFPPFGPPPRGGSARTVQPGHFILL